MAGLEATMATRAFVGGALVGGGLVYFLDPARGPGRRRRAAARLGWPRPVSSRYGSRLGDIDGLAAANLPSWSGVVDAERLTRVVGGALALYGLLRPGRVGALTRLLGMGIAAIGTSRAASVAPAPVRPERRRTIDIQKSLHVDAPPGRVFAFASAYENLPRVLADVRDVRTLGGDRSRWVVRGPGGVSLTWTAVVTERVPNRLLAWRSEPGAVLEHAGVLRFREEGRGTRVDVRVCYSPPGAHAGRPLADFFGGDPRARINDDLGRLKRLLESTVRSEVHGEESGS
jgi:uncharacterized membrane protein